MSEEKTIKKSDLLRMQEEGMKREEIAKHYGVSDQEMKKYFTFLKINTKAKKKNTYTLVNDIDGESFTTRVPEQEEKIA